MRRNLVKKFQHTVAECSGIRMADGKVTILVMKLVKLTLSVRESFEPIRRKFTVDTKLYVDLTVAGS